MVSDSDTMERGAAAIVIVNFDSLKQFETFTVKTRIKIKFFDLRCFTVLPFALFISNPEFLYS
jgi:hypothetical protein